MQKGIQKFPQKIVGCFGVFIVLTPFVASTAFASSSFIQKDKIDIPATETVSGNYYGNAETVLISGQVLGNAYISGGSITINGKFSKDLSIAGGEVTIEGATISGDLRVFAGEVKINNSQIGDELVVGAGRVNLDSRTVINGTVLAGAGEATFENTINEDLIIGARTLKSKAIIKGEAYIGSENIQLDSGTDIAGNVYYSSTNKANVDSTAKIAGGVNQVTPMRPADTSYSNQFLANIRNGVWGILSSLIIGFIILSLFYKESVQVMGKLTERTWASLGWGFATIILMPILSILLMITLIGIPAGIILLILYVLLLYLTHLFMSLVLGNWIVNRKQEEMYDRRWLMLIVGLVTYTLLVSLPTVGGLFTLFSITIVLGSLFMTGRDWILSRNAEKK